MKHLAKELFAKFQKSKKSKLLPVFINGYMGDIEDIFVRKLRESFIDIGHEKYFDNFIKTVSMEQGAIIKKWEKAFPEIYTRYCNMLKEHNETPVLFKRKLQQGLFSARGLFDTIYSEITGGGSYSNNAKSDVIGLYKKCIRHLRAKGYAGIYVVYDEFGKYLEKGIQNPSLLNVQFLQDFSEYCDRSGKNQCHLTLITHLSVSQYASKLPINVQKEWAKVEGRFNESSFFDRNTNHYKMIQYGF